MRGGWSNGRKAAILGLICVAALVLTWFFARVPWFLISIVLTVWGWGIALAQMWHFRHENRRPDRSAPSYHRPRSPAPQPRPPAPRPRQAPQPRPAARRPAGQGPGEPA